MKKLIFLCCIFFIMHEIFAQSITLKVDSYRIDGRQTASQYEKAELTIDEIEEEVISVGGRISTRFLIKWKIILYKKDNSLETIDLEQLDPISRGIGVFRKVSIHERTRIIGGLFASVPPFNENDNKIQIEFRDEQKESVKRRLVLVP